MPAFRAGILKQRVVQLEEHGRIMSEKMEVQILPL